jgi:hypothetical protein
MDWNNVDLNSGYEREQNILDPLSFDTFLLEISTNIRNINTEAVVAEFNKRLDSRVQEAKDIFKSNLENIVKQAQKERGKI